ncbi:MAG: TolC family protein [Chlorobi bacterium]|nr:TolC family protein [Chlorobiota bacterium]
MKRTIFTGILIFGLATINIAQDTITLELCHEKAIENYPLTRQDSLLSVSNELKIKNLNKNYLPQLMVNGQIHYQSDVISIQFENLPGINIPKVEKDWYKITLDANQVIYDGGMTAKQKELENTKLAIDRQNVELELYKLKERINNIYFSILLFQENNKTLLLLKKNLKAKLKDVNSGVENGLVLASNADILKAEIIKLEQNIIEIEIGLNTSKNIMNEYTGLALNESTSLSLPETEINTSIFENNRPEYELMSLQQNQLDAMKNVTGRKLAPRLSAFGQAGYGRPGYDMLKNEFVDFYMIGARLNWNIWDWNLSKKEKEVLDIQSEMINTQKETFDKNLKVDLQNKLAEIRKVEELIKRDKEIIVLRERISKASSSQLDNGVITSTEYLTEINAEAGAKLNMTTHKIQLEKAKIDYRASLGDF